MLHVRDSAFAGSRIIIISLFPSLRITNVPLKDGAMTLLVHHFLEEIK